MNGQEELFSELYVYQATAAVAKETILDEPLNITGRHVNICAVKNLDSAATLTVEVGIYFRNQYMPCFQKKTLAAGDVSTFAREFDIPKDAHIYVLALSSAGTINANIHINGHDHVNHK